MAFIPVPNTALVEIIMGWDGQTIENTIYVENGAGWTTTSLNTLAALVKTWWNDNMKSMMPGNLQLIAIRCTDLTSASGPVVDYSTGLPLTGIAASPSMPNNVALCLTFLTDSRGRSYRGRNYVPGLSEGNVTANDISSLHVAAVVAAYADLAADLVAAGYQHVVASRFTNNAPRVTGVATPVTGYRGNTVVDSQRRRLPGRGA